MFTGIIEGIGTVKAVTRKGYGVAFEIDVNFEMGDVNVGDSISIDGCCLTVTSRLGRRFWADISDETLRISTLGGIKEGNEINVERSLKIGSRLGGHMVQGHVDGVGKIAEMKDVSGAKELQMQIPERLNKYIVVKGSISVNGVSLTVNNVERNLVSIRIIPHTFESTTFKHKSAGDHVNLEVDIIGKYVEKLGLREVGKEKAESKITEDFLKKHGF